MTSRLGKPDTPADATIRTRLNEPGTRHFIMVAGAGSGKTTSFIKALNHLSKTSGERFRKRSQQIACVTYTDVAVSEILGDVAHDSLFHVSTIHSFLWSVIKPFQSDIHAWVRRRLEEKIAESEAKIVKPRTRASTIEKERANIERYRDQLSELDSVERFTYGTGSDYLNGVLGHSDILKLGPALITEHALMRRVVAQRFPVIFVDESQDTAPDFVDALKALAADAPPEFCVGFFGDPVQRIYQTGIGAISLEANWEAIEKPENFRCPTSVLNVINRIRAEADGLVQTRGRMTYLDGEMVPVDGTARLFILPADVRRAERLAGVRAWLANENHDPLWLDDNVGGGVRMLVIVHRIAATRLGFSNIYSALNDKAPESFKNGLIDGQAWIVRPFIRHLLPLLEAYRSGDNFKVIRLLRKSCPRLSDDYIQGQDVAVVLDDLQACLVMLDEMMQIGSTVPIGEVVSFVRDRGLAELDERFTPVLEEFAENSPVGANAPENSAVRFLRCNAGEIWGYRSYIENQSPFSTQQGIKGAEFDRVLVVVDDEESTMPSFSYGKYFGFAPLSDKDQDNIANGRESVVERTRRLFYVCCSRAVQDLAVVVFAHDVEAVSAIVIAKGYFEPGNTHLLEL